MKNNLLNKETGLFLLASIIISSGILFLIVSALSFKKDEFMTQTASPHEVQNQILAKGSVRSQNEADLHFQTGGKLIYLPYKEGDVVSQGQTIGSLDSYAIAKQLQ